MQPSFEQILSFVYVVETGSFRGAARKLNKTQPTISAAIQHLELELGFKLFEREYGKVTLTEKGERLKETALPLVYHYQALRSSAETIKHSDRIIYRIGIDPMVSSQHILHIIHMFSEAFPDTDLSIISKPSSLLGKLISDNKLDIAIGNPYQKQIYDYAIVKLFTVNCWWVTHKNFDQNRSIPTRLLLLEGSQESGSELLAKEHKIWQCGDLNTIVRLCLDKSGIALLPEFILEAFESKNIVKVNNQSDLCGLTLTAAIFWDQKKESSIYSKWLVNALTGESMSNSVS